MRNSYLGIATPRGLEVFEAESRHLSRFLVRRAYRSGTNRAVCFWATMDDSIAATVWGLMRQGHDRDALLIVETLAFETGVICPDEIELPVFLAG